MTKATLSCGFCHLSADLDSNQSTYSRCTPFAKTAQGLAKVSQTFSPPRNRKLKNPLSARLDLNQGPPRYKLGALPTELQADKIFFNFIHHFISEFKYFRACLFDSCCKLRALPTELSAGDKTITHSEREDKLVRPLRKATAGFKGLYRETVTVVTR